MDPRELQPHSPHAPGPVLCEEQLLRLQLGQQYLAGNRLQPEGISRADLQERGFSVQRASYLTPDRFRVFKAEFAGRGKPYQGCFPMITANVRAILDEQGRQGFIVIDHVIDPMDKGHAHIFAANHYKPSSLKRLRQKLSEAIGELFFLDPHALQNLLS